MSKSIDLQLRRVKRSERNGQDLAKITQYIERELRVKLRTPDISFSIVVVPGGPSSDMLIRHQRSRKAVRKPIQVRFKHLPGYRLARWVAEGAVRLARFE